jgi:hypothetical protein
VITRLEYGEQGNNLRYGVSNLAGKPQTLYDELYCQCGEAQNRNKLLKLAAGSHPQYPAHLAVFSLQLALC